MRKTPGNHLPNPICWRVEWRDSGSQISDCPYLHFIYLLKTQIESLTTPSVPLPWANKILIFPLHKIQVPSCKRLHRDRKSPWSPCFIGKSTHFQRPLSTANRWSLPEKLIQFSVNIYSSLFNPFFLVIPVTNKKWMGDTPAWRVHSHLPARTS